MRFFNFNMANIDAWQASSLHEETVSAVQPYLILCFRMFQHFRQPVFQHSCHHRCGVCAARQAALDPFVGMCLGSRAFGANSQTRAAAEPFSEMRSSCENLLVFCCPGSLDVNNGRQTRVGLSRVKMRLLAEPCKRTRQTSSRKGPVQESKLEKPHSKPESAEVCTVFRAAFQRRGTS